MKIKILVFPCGSEIGLEIHNALKWSTHIELWGASSVADHGKYVYKNYIETLPNIDDKNFIEKLNILVKKYQIDYVFPAHDSVVLKIAEEAKNIPCKIIGSPFKTCQICRSKKKTYEIFKSIINVPKIFNNTKDINEYPVFLKPEIGQGSRGTYIAYSSKEVEFYLQKDPTLLRLEYLPGDEFTVDCFTDKDGNLKFAKARKRNRISNGISVNTFSVENSKFLKIAQKINKTLIFRGTWFFQIKKNKFNKLCLLEIGPRIAGSMAYYRNIGINFPLLSIFDTEGLETKIIENKYKSEMDRALFNRFNLNLKYKHVYIDLDDTIILNHNINPFIIMFLYQCINNQVKLHLLTRHESSFKDNLKDILKKYRISEIFDTVTNIQKEKNKYNLIGEKNAIFIDDSFIERWSVFKKLRIPVFDTNSIESLINWKY